MMDDKGFYLLSLGLIKSAIKDKDIEFLKSEAAEALCDAANLNIHAIIENTTNPKAKRKDLYTHKTREYKLVKLKGEDLERLKKILTDVNPSELDDGHWVKDVGRKNSARKNWD